MDSARALHCLNPIPVRSLNDPRLEPYRNQKDAWLRARARGGTGLGDGFFLAEGELVVRALAGSGHEIVSVLCTPERLAAMGDLLRGRPEIQVFIADRPLLEAVLGFDLHRGILALGRRREPPRTEDLIARAHTLIVCEDLSNHDNIGAVFRNTACLLGAPASGEIPAAILLSPRCCDPLYRKSLRVSMGHALRVPFATLEPWPEALQKLEAAGFSLLALTPHPSATPVSGCEHSPNTRRAILVGAERQGLSPAVMARARERVRIPMAPGADSLNVATALAVALSHLAPAASQSPEPPGLPASP